MSAEAVSCELSPKAYASSQDPRWCPGCGNYSILTQVKKVLAKLGAKRENTVFVSGIGCSSRFPYYVDTYGFHGIHGRALSTATGVRLANPDLSVWVIMGDGDGLSIGGNHLLHTIRRNVDLNILLFNNRIYGLTKGQYSPTSPFGKRTRSTPMGSVDFPLYPLSVAIGAEATFVARSLDVNVHHLEHVLERAARHRGSSFVEIYINCSIFNNMAFDYASSRSTKDETTIYLEHDRPLVFAGGHKGIRLHGTDPEIVELDHGAKESGLLVHDETQKEPSLAYLLSRMRYPDFPEPMGVFRCVERPTYEELVMGQIEEAKARRPGHLEDLFNEGETWTVE